MTSYDQAFQAAATLGITVCCAAGDNGSADAETDGLAHVDFPASSPSRWVVEAPNLLVLETLFLVRWSGMRDQTARLVVG